MYYRELTYSRELLNTLMPLFEKHYEEIAVYKDIPLSIDDEIYQALGELDKLRIFVATDELGEIHGYSVYIVSTNIHYSKCLEAKNDVIYIDKEYRGFGTSFIEWCDRQLKLESIQIVYHHIKPEHDWSKILTGMGYAKYETMYAKRLDKE